MRVILRPPGFEVFAESKQEEDYLRTVLERLEFIFKPSYTVWINGVKIVGRSEGESCSE